MCYSIPSSANKMSKVCKEDQRWNAKECYLVHYRGLRDFEDAKNQWFRGPTKAMNSKLQKTIDGNLRLTGKEGKYKIFVAKEGMVWTASLGFLDPYLLKYLLM